MTDWKPLDSAPLNKTVLLWWVGGSKLPKAPPSCEIGAVSSHEQDMVWSCGQYLPLRFYTHWAPLPDGPSSVSESADKEKAK